MRIVVTGLIATFPLGGVAWDCLQYVEGFRRLGHEVFYLEDSGQWLYDPVRRTFTDDADTNAAYLRRVLRWVPGMESRWSLHTPTGRHYGLDSSELRRVCDAADLWVNVSGAGLFRAEYRGCRAAVYIDTDPLYTQARLAAVEAGEGTSDDTYFAELLRLHTRWFTFAERIGSDDCGVPSVGLPWQPTRQPIILDWWPARFTPEAEVFTTVMSWTAAPAPPVYGGIRYGGKDVEFLRFADLPKRTRVPLEVAITGAAPRTRLSGAGWRVTDGHAVSATPEGYRDYLAASRGEWTVAKQAYVATRSGWFGTRTAAYLASGKPAVIQDTGLAAHYPVGEGLRVFRTMEEAVEALEEVDRDYLRHSRAARRIAETCFDANRVLSNLLAAI